MSQEGQEGACVWAESYGPFPSGRGPRAAAGSLGRCVPTPQGAAVRATVSTSRGCPSRDRLRVARDLGGARRGGAARRGEARVVPRRALEHRVHLLERRVLRPQLVQVAQRAVRRGHLGDLQEPLDLLPPPREEMRRERLDLGDRAQRRAAERADALRRRLARAAGNAAAGCSSGRVHAGADAAPSKDGRRDAGAPRRARRKHPAARRWPPARRRRHRVPSGRAGSSDGHLRAWWARAKMGKPVCPQQEPHSSRI